ADVFFRFRPVSLLNGFTDPGQRLDAVTGVKTWGINHMMIPFPPRQALRRSQRKFELSENPIEMLHSFGSRIFRAAQNIAARPIALGRDVFEFGNGVIER